MSAVAEKKAAHIKSIGPKLAPGLPHRKLAALCQSLIQKTDPEDDHIFQFVSAYNGEGTAQIAFETAHLMSSETQANILFIDASMAVPDSLQPVMEHVLTSLSDYTGKSNTQATCVYNIQGTTLSVCRLYPVQNGTAHIISAEALKPVLEDLKSTFEIIILYAEGVLVSENTASIASLANSTMLVVQAERTRAPVIRQLKEKLEEHGANIIGAIFSGRQFHIPGWIYKLFFKN